MIIQQPHEISLLRRIGGQSFRSDLYVELIGRQLIDLRLRDLRLLLGGMLGTTKKTVTCVLVAS